MGRRKIYHCCLLLGRRKIANLRTQGLELAKKPKSLLFQITEVPYKEIQEKTVLIQDDCSNIPKQRQALRKAKRNLGHYTVRNQSRSYSQPCTPRYSRPDHTLLINRIWVATRFLEN